mgnify:CR=1 FL=1
MAGGAMLIIGLRCDTEVIDDIFFAKPLLVFGVEKLPGPVLGFMDLLSCLGVTLDAGTGHIRAGVEIDLKLFEFSVISSCCRIG